MIGKTISPYKILDRLGVGGMSQNHPRIAGGERFVILRIPMSKAKSGGII